MKKKVYMALMMAAVISMAGCGKKQPIHPQMQHRN